jgi:hypothetical protein
VSHRRNRPGRGSSARKQTSWRRSLSFVPLEFAVLSEAAIYRLRSEPFLRQTLRPDQKDLSTVTIRIAKTNRKVLKSRRVSFPWLGEMPWPPLAVLRSLTLKSRKRSRNCRWILFAFILDSHGQALKHTRSPSDIPQPPPSYCGYPKVCQSRINRFSSIRMNRTRERIHSRYKTWAN